MRNPFKIVGQIMLGTVAAVVIVVSDLFTRKPEHKP